MSSRKLSAMFAVLTVLTLLLAACSSGATPQTTPKTAAIEPTAKPAPAATQAEAKPVASPAAASPATTPKPSSEQPRSGGTITIGTTGDPLSFDMHQEASYLVANVIQCAYSGVVQFDPENPDESIGDLAKSWDISKDGLTYTFNLFDNVKWHDGSAFSSDDVKFSFDRQISPPKGVGAPRRADLAAVDHLETPDKNTVKFVLKYPSSSFLDVISSGLMMVFSRSFVDKKGDMRRDVMGTGPYKLKDYSFGSSLTYVKNPDYFVKGLPYLDGLTFYIIKDPGTRLAAFRTGQLKLTGPGDAGPTASDAELLKKTMPQAVIVSYPSYSFVNFILNIKEKPWDDVRVREAAHLAIDRQKAVAVLGQGFGSTWSNFPGKWSLPKEQMDQMPGWRQPKDADIARAKQLMADAGYANGVTVKTLVRAEKFFEEAAVYVQDQEAKIGIKMELDVKEPAVRTTLLNQGAFNNHPLQSSLSYPDPANVARYWAAPLKDDWGMNWQHLEDKEIIDLFDKQSRALDPKERLNIVHQLDLKMINSYARDIVYWSQSLLAMWPEVRGRGKLNGNYSFQKYQNLWLAK